jgi:type VI secretion system secreted protein VgrG
MIKLIKLLIFGMLISLTASCQNKSTTITNKISLEAQEYKQNIDKNKTVDIRGDLKETTGTTTHKAIAGDILTKSSGVSKLLGATDAKVNKG